MSTRFVNIDRKSPMLLPPDLRDWLPANHIARLIVEVIEWLDLRSFRTNDRGTGDCQYPPSMLAALLIYCYATGRFSSRRIEEATYSDVAVRYIAGGTHPDHDTLCAFRVRNGRAFAELFVKVLAIAGESGLVKKVGGVSVDGTKIHANASKHSAVSYDHAGKLIEQLTLEVSELVRKAEAADSVPLDDGLAIPDEVARRKDRIASLRQAREIIERRFEAERAEAQAAYAAKVAEREAKRREGRRPRGPDPKPPADTPPGDRQHNFTDPESAIMKAGSGAHFEQCYNAQATVDVEGSMLILGQHVTAAANDKQQLQPTVASVDPAVRKVTEVLADSGYFSGPQVKAVETAGATAYVAVEKGRHGRTVASLERRDDPPPPPPDATAAEVMAHRLKTRRGRDRYKLRKETVEPVFGIVKHAMGFRQFHLRGHPKVSLEWCIVCISYNFRRLFRLDAGGSLSANLKLCAENA